jgi:hypothetical protein
MVKTTKMPQEAQEHRDGQEWLERAGAGDFSSIPIPFDWQQSVGLAHLIDGYRIAGGFEQCAAVSARVTETYSETGEWSANALDLWLTLFFEHRRWRHFGYSPDGDDRVPLDRCARRCERSRKTSSPASAPGCSTPWRGIRGRQPKGADLG